MPTFTPFKEIPEVVLVQLVAHGDARGWFMETFKRSEFAKHGLATDYAQDNHSRSVGKHTLRGLHYQAPPHAQAKLVRCSEGEVLDVAVDIRRSSPTFGRHVTTVLSETNQRMLWIPEGFAHGLLTLTEVAEVQYKVTREYAPTHDRVIRWDDPALGIAWPAGAPTLSKKDAAAPLLRDAEVFP
jgi:dTDP-4-dehydrorhamnose 3,5-epimerase